MRYLSEYEKIEQERMPILDMTRAFVRNNEGYFCIPGHRFERGMNPRLREQYGEGLFRYDLTETDRLDDLHHAEGPILEAQKLAARLFGSDRCFFLVNGTTCGNEAMILTAVNPGEKILVPRNAHKSVTMGLILSGAVPVWIEPEGVEAFGTAGVLSPELVDQYLCDQPDIKAVFLVSPTYYGICSDVRKLSEICHAHGVPLLVDEAHGSHLYFHPAFPEGAMEAGADACAQSTHKTLGSMTQTSMLHMQGDLLDQNRMDENLKLVMSTSPSYVLMAAIDAARQQMAVEGQALLSIALKRARQLKDGVSRLKGYRILETDRQDPLRVVISADAMGIGGEKLQELLYKKGKISLELSDPVSVVLVLTWGNTKEEIEHLLTVLNEIHKEYFIQNENMTHEEHSFPSEGNTTSPRYIPGINQTPDSSHSINEARYMRESSRYMREHFQPEVACTPREAYYRQKESVPLEESVGRIAGELIAPYPPGIPVLCPGERITKPLVSYLKTCADRKCILHGPADETLSTIRVLI